MSNYEMSLGGLQSPVDYRDIPFEAVASATILPKKHIEDISKLPVDHQRKIGACVGHAGAKYVQYLNLLETGAVEAHSPRFLYGLAKCRDGYNFEGTYPRLVAKIVMDHGCALENLIVNDTKLSHDEYVYFRKEANLPSGWIQNARPYMTSGYAFPDVKNVDSLKRAIIDGHGAMLLVNVGQEWYTAKNGQRSWKARDILPLRAPVAVISGHEVFLFGYEVEKDGRTKFYILNSWSDDWGEKGVGYFYFDTYGPHIKEAITFVDIPNNTIKTIDQLPNQKTFRFYFGTDIEAGERGPRVVAHQTALMIDGMFSRELYAELLKNNELGYFKPKGVTQEALLRFQTKYSVASLAELQKIGGTRAGAKTRAQLNNLFGG